MIRSFLLKIIMLCAASSVFGQNDDQFISAMYVVKDSMEIALVPSDFPVNLCLLTDHNRQYVAYYDDERRMTIASRLLNSGTWQYQVLPSKVGWDSHNYITMAVDSEGQLHVSGNMHVDTLIYFRTQKPGNITTLHRYSMTGKLENRVTYPKFLKDNDGHLVYNYRDGGSGNGMRIYNIYDAETKSWSRLLDKPMLDGEGERNAYPLGPVRGPDGLFHIVWVWRDTPDCATNHHLSYARSNDLLHWKSVFGQDIELPMLLEKKSLWVDPIPSGGGIINGCEKLYFDSNHTPVITYHKSDEQGNMQIYAARPEKGVWKINVLTDWEKPILFAGRGSMGFIGIRISGLSQIEPGLLTMTYRHRDYGEGRLFIDEQTLQPVSRNIEIQGEYPAELNHIRNSFEGMQIRRAEDIGSSPDSSVRYILQWETLGRNFDRPRKPPLPEPVMLVLYKLSAVKSP